MLKINVNDVMNKNEIINDFDSLEWKEKLMNKSTLFFY